MAPDLNSSTHDTMKQGQDALSRSDWTAARSAFESALAAEPENAVAMEGAATAAWWQHDEVAVFSSREAAYRLYLSRGDLQGAARTAVWLALDSLEFRGQSAVSNGWLQRAKRHLDGLGPVPEKCWLDINEGHIALMVRNDTSAAITLGRSGAEIARQIGLIDMEALGTGLEGLATVSAGHVVDGMTMLDEAGAAIASGNVSDPIIITTIICYIVDACDRVRDVERAAQWCAHMQKFARQIGMEELAAVCRPHYAVLLMWQGAWNAAERELTRAMRDLEVARPQMAVEPMIRLAELRIRQGRYREAGELLETVRAEPLALLPRAEMALTSGNSALARELAERRLRQLPADDVVERVYPLESLVRSCIASGDTEAAAIAAAELERTSKMINTLPTSAAALWARGQVAASEESNSDAINVLEEAADLYERADVSYEAARVRFDLARSLRQHGSYDRSAEQAMLALEVFRGLGAAGDAARVEAFLGVPSVSTASPVRLAGAGGLTAREIEILRLLASGQSNAEIAAELVLSVRTVERHVTNLYRKIGAAGGTARATATGYAFRHGLLSPIA